MTTPDASTPSTMTVREMKEELVNDHGLKYEDLEGVGRTALRRQIIQFRKLKRASKPAIKPQMQPLPDTNPAPATQPAKNKPATSKPLPKKAVVTKQAQGGNVTPTDPEWTQFVVGHLAEDEMIEDHPTIDGLRRLASLFIGPIMSKQSDLVDVPRPDNGMRAIVRVRVTYAGPTGNVIHDGMADVCDDNCDPMYARFLSSSAETRAEARCHRSALMLRRVVSAEELPGSIKSDSSGNEPAAQGFLSGLQIMCSNAGISAAKVLVSMGVSGPINKLSNAQAKAMLVRVNEIRSQNPIPAEFAGE